MLKARIYMSNRERREYLECGKIVNTHGVGGAVKIESWCDDLETLADLNCIYLLQNGNYIKKKIISASILKKHVIARLEGIVDVDTAATLKECIVYASRDDIPLEEGDYFIIDLIGLPVIDVDSGIKYGEISEVFNAGASDIYTVRTERGEAMIPAVPEFIIRIDIETGVFVRPIEGMFDI
jgi:16S rRNA processing protein RimM